MVDNTDSFLARFNSREQVQKYVDRFQHRKRHRTDLREKAALIELMEVVGKVDVLDLPCGPGRFNSIWTRYAGHVVLADASQAVLDFIASNLPFNASCLKTRAESIALPSESVDVVFCHRFLHHVPSRTIRGQIFREFHRVTRRHLILPFYPAGRRNRLRWRWRSWLGRVHQHDLLSNERQCLSELRDEGFCLVRRRHLRRFPSSAFLLCEK